MMYSLSKRLLALMLSVSLLLGCFPVLADEAAQESVATLTGEPQGVDMTRPSMCRRSPFMDNLLTLLGSADLSDHQLALTVPQEITGLFGDLAASAQMQDGLASLHLSQGGFALGELQSDGQTVWLNLGGQVYAVRIDEIAELLRDAAGLTVLYNLLTSAESREAAAQNLALFYQHVLKDGITVSQGMDGAMVVTVQLNGRQLLDGLADYLDALSGNPSLAAALGLRKGTADLLFVGTAAAYAGATRGSMAEDYDAAAVQEQVRQLLHEAAESLRKAQLDFFVFANATVKTDRGTQVGVRATVVAGGQTLSVDFSLTVNGDQGGFTVRVYDSRMEYGNLALNWRTAGGNTMFDLKGTVGSISAALYGSLSPDALRIEASLQSAFGAVISGSLTAMHTEDGTLVTVNGADGYGAFSGEILIAPGRTSASLRFPYMNADATFLSAEDGTHPFHISIASYYRGTTIDWDGHALTMGDRYSTVKFAFREISDTQLAIDGTSTLSNGYYYGNGEPYTQTVTVLLTINKGDTPDDEWSLSAAYVADGVATPLGTLAYKAQRAQQPLADQKPMVITRETVIQYVWDLLRYQVEADNRYAQEYEMIKWEGAEQYGYPYNESSESFY